MPKKILLADDSITIQKVVELTFSDGDYEVTAVNNGAKAIQKLAEMRPDIILSDIIMPEKNGYEVCEFVKSHPEFRSIPIILLTGTFEPFDPDRAEKAGCDAVVTKPFESQSLIHKVEELIAQSTPAGAAAESAPAEETWATGPAEPAGWGESPQSGGEQEAPAPWGESPADPFAAAPPTVEVPYTEPAVDAGPTATSPFARDFGSDDDAPAEPAASGSPWDEQPAFSGETRTFQKMSFDDFEKVQAPEPEPAAEQQQDLESPFGAPPPAEEFSGETRAFTKLSFDDLARMSGESSTAATEPAAETEPPPMVSEAAPETAPWQEEAEPAASEAPSWDAPPPPPAPWEEPPAYAGETRAFQKMSFEELDQMATETAPPAEAQPWQEEPQPPQEPSFAAPSFIQEEDPQPAADAAASVEPQPESLPWSERAEPAWVDEPRSAAADDFARAPAEAPSNLGDLQPEPSRFSDDRLDEPVQAVEELPIPQAEPEPAWSEPAPAAAAAPSADRPFEVTDELVDRIARRVIELMSDQVIRSIAWEVIPDAAEIAVKERIRQLEMEEV